MSIKKISNIKKFLTVVTCCILLSLSFVIIIFRQNVSDQIRVWSFYPSKQISLLADRSGLNSFGKYIYYTGLPVLESTQNFNSACERVENVTSILGCYSKGRIYIYNVIDTKLDGIREVTASHETLHAAYARLSDEEKTKVNKLLQIEYEKIKNNEEYSSRMAFYARTEPNQINNELHSVIGTEIADVSPELEEYFNKYFSDRTKVVSLNQKYLSVFNSLKDRANQLTSQITNLAQSITDSSNQYNQDVNQINSDISNFNTRANNGSFTSQYQFDIERDELVNRVAILEQNRNNINSMVDQYKSLINEYNSITTESNKLHNSIDSTLAPAPSI